jgi:hypothetical protein
MFLSWMEKEMTFALDHKEAHVQRTGGSLVKWQDEWLTQSWKVTRGENLQTK